MSDHPLSRIPATDADNAYATLTAAYRNDPVQRWLFPDDDVYAVRFPAVLAAVGGSAFQTSTAWRPDEVGAVALWIAPGSEPDAERIGGLLFGAVSPDKHHDLLGILEQSDAALPKYPHWYLSWLGVEPSKQGNGLGTRLLAACLEYVDLGGLSVHLLASNPRNIAFLGRHGFAVADEVQSGAAPPIAFMIREGRHP